MRADPWGFFDWLWWGWGLLGLHVSCAESEMDEILSRLGNSRSDRTVVNKQIYGTGDNGQTCSLLAVVIFLDYRTRLALDLAAPEEAAVARLVHLWVVYLFTCLFTCLLLVPLAGRSSSPCRSRCPGTWRRSHDRPSEEGYGRRTLGRYTVPRLVARTHPDSCPGRRGCSAPSS